MEEGKDRQVVIDGEMSVRKGAYSNIAMARTSKYETIVDFGMVDALGDDGNTTMGVLQSRVIMSNQAFVEFAQMIQSHFENNFKKAEDDE